MDRPKFRHRWAAYCNFPGSRLTSSRIRTRPALNSGSATRSMKPRKQVAKCWQGLLRARALAVAPPLSSFRSAPLSGLRFEQRPSGAVVAPEHRQSGARMALTKSARAPPSRSDSARALCSVNISPASLSLSEPGLSEPRSLRARPDKVGTRNTFEARLLSRVNPSLQCPFPASRPNDPPFRTSGRPRTTP